jgi:ATP-dependent protease HslVU (ClpYQ) peptidase subunit
LTTIAYKDGIIAYDSRITEGDMIVSDSYNKKHEIGGLVIFSAGNLGCDEDFATAYITKETDAIENAQGIVVDNGELFICTIASGEVQVYKWDKVEVRACGSGEPYAITAMDTGATAKEAVEYAKKRDVNTGGRVRTWVIN